MKRQPKIQYDFINTKDCVKRVKFIEELMRRTGFTRLYYVSENGNVRLRSMSDECFMVLPNEVPYAYDDRILQVNYPYAAKLEQAAKS